MESEEPVAESEEDFDDIIVPDEPDDEADLDNELSSFYISL